MFELRPSSRECRPGQTRVLRHPCAWLLTSLVWLATLVGGPTSARAGSILREVFAGIGGSAVADLTNNPAFPSSPSSTNLVTDFFEAPTDIDENYGQRMHGYILPPVTGNYRFWIASDDGSVLYLGTNELPSTARAIARVDAWTSARAWTTEPGQQSALIRLQAGQPYYISALQKEGGGGDNLAVRWLRPDGIDEGPIPATYLQPFGVSFTPPVIVTQPADTSVIEGQLATFTVTTANFDAVALWQRNGTPIPNNPARTLVYGPVTMADEGSTFGATLTNRQGSVETRLAKLHILPDITPPQVLSAINRGITAVLVRFSEPLSEASANAPANYAMNGGITVTGASLQPDQQSVLLAVTPMTPGQAYEVLVQQVTDQAQTPNPVPANSLARFTARELVSLDLGTTGGSLERLDATRWNITAGGADIGGKADQFQYGWEERTGNFDVQVRVDTIDTTDPFVHAGLMARAALTTNSMFAAVFAASPQVGSFLESRATTGAASTTTAPVGGFPVNPPQTWLRLRKVGNIFTGFGSLDGQTWVQFGNVNVALPSTYYLGLALSAGTTNQTTTAQFREYGSTVSQTTGTYTPSHEPLGPVSRRTSLVFSEIMYHAPGDAVAGRSREFVELYNADTIFEELGGWRVTGDIEYEFPAGFVLRAGEFVAIAADPVALAAASGATRLQGPYIGTLSHSAGTLRLLDKTGAIKLEFTYGTEAPWPVAPDGAGHSLTLVRPSYGLSDARAWGSSEQIGGSPGRFDTVVANPQATVFLNEFLIHPGPTQAAFLELYNHANADVDLSGCYLTDSPSTNRYRLPAGTTISARGFLSLTAAQLGFSPNPTGDTIYLVSSNGLRVIDALRFGPQERGVASGRTPDGAETVRRLSEPTPGQSNATWRTDDVVINELMYSPISGDSDDEYIELFNRGTNTVDLSNWRLADAVTFKFPEGTLLPASGYLVIGRNVQQLRAHYAQLQSTNSVGNYNGSLGNSGDHLRLTRPDTLVTTNDFGEVQSTAMQVTVADLTYGSGGRWGRYSDGGGSSLELIDPRADPLRPSSWSDSDESQKSTWNTYTVTGTLTQGMDGYSPNRLHLGLLGMGETLVDDVEVIGTAGTNQITNTTFDNGASGWTFLGNHSTSTVDAAGGTGGSRCLHIRAQGDNDTANNTIRSPISGTLGLSSQVTLRIKARWLAGWPELLVRLHGNWLELAARLDLPLNLGTPGLPNSRAVDNAGPAIFAVTHNPSLPRANQPVVVTCRVVDPDGIANVTLRYRVEPATTQTTVTMRDDGAAGDAVAGDGIFSATIPGRSSGAMAGFTISSTDAAVTNPATAGFPASAWIPFPRPLPECLIRWEDAIPAGNFAHYHLWSSQATENLRQGSTALNNTYREATLVYGNFRVIYQVGFRDKGSPFHGGGGSFSVINPDDEPLLGVTERIFRATGNGGSEATGLRNTVSAWIGKELGIPYLHAHYMQLYRNGGQFNNLTEDEEAPSNEYARSWFPAAGSGDLYKIAIWFEFPDDNSTFGAIQSTLEDFRLANKQPNRARYRWNWQTRGYQGTANNYTNIFNLVRLANDTTTNFVPNLTRDVDVDEWMHVFAFNRVLGNWDSYTFSVGQNMYLLKSPTQRYVLMPWDIDFTLGDGNGPSDGLWGGQDPILNRWYDTPALRRMLWRAYQDALAGPLNPARYAPVIEARRAALAKNGIGGLSAPTSVLTYLAARRTFLQQQLTANDVTSFAVTTPAGASLTSTKPLVTLAGRAPFAVASILINGVEYPTTWDTQNTFSIGVPLGAPTNVLVLNGVDRNGRAVPGASSTITVRYTGAVQNPQDFLVINEVHYNPIEPNTSFIEIHNRSTVTPFDLSGWRLEGVGATLPDGALLPPLGYGVIAKDRLGLAATYGAGINVLTEYPGSLNNGGEHLKLVKPLGVGGTNDLIVSDVRYDQSLPWPTNANGFGPSLQLLDPARGSYRVANWATAATNASPRATPGKANSLKTSLPAFPELWINEVLPRNVTGPVDGHGEHDPYIEIYNAGSVPVDLSTLYLSDSYTNLTRWPFPAGASLAAGAFVVVWADGQPAHSTATEFHTNFRLNPDAGTLALSRIQSGLPATLDYVTYQAVPADRSLGLIPDGEPRNRRLLFHPTAGAANDPVFPKLAIAINEFLAANVATLVNPVGGKADDWVEFYNADSESVDLTGYTVTDDPATPAKFTIPGGFVIPGNGFLLAWADKNASANSGSEQLHLSFKLSKSGGFIGLFAPDGARVDGITYGAQSTDVSQGRLPDGGELPLVPLTPPTPGGSNNVLGGNQPPVLTPISARQVGELQLLEFVAQASDPDVGQTLRFSLAAGAPAGAEIDPITGRFLWTPNESQGPGIYSLALRVTDSGTPPRSATQRFTVTVQEINQAPVLAALEDRQVDEGSLLAFIAGASDPDQPANQLRFSLAAPIPAGAQIDPLTGAFTWTPVEAQGPATYPVTVVVTDDGTPAKSASRTFQIRVNEINNPPVLDPIGPKTIAEGSLLTVVAHAQDPDQPPAGLVYTLEGDLPSGIRIQPATGVIEWTPTELQGPGTYIIVVRATEQDARHLSSVESFGIQVTEVNQAPVLASLPTLTVQEGDPVVVTAQAIDPDLPLQTLTYGLGAGAPAEAAIDPQTGVFTWITPAEAGRSTNQITLTVHDDGPGALTDSKVLTVITTPRFRAVLNEILYRPETTNAAFVELYNPSTATPQDLTGVVLAGENLRYAFPVGATLAPGAYLVLARDRAAFATAYPGVSVFDQWSGTLDRFNTRLALQRKNAAGTLVTLQEVDYRATLPWSTNADSAGTSLQLLDARRDGSRVGNWTAAANNGWRYVVQTGVASSSTLYIYLETVGEAYIDDVKLVAGRVPEVGVNQLANGDFEGAFPGPFTISANLATSSRATDIRHGGAAGLHLISTSPGSTRGSSIFQDIVPALTANAEYTLSYWYLPNPAGGTLTLRLSGSGIKSTVNLLPEPNAVTRTTPGAANSVAAALAEFPPVWINEVEADNRTGIADASGAPGPWIELINPGLLPIDLSGWFLSPSYAPLNTWSFPAGTRIPGGDFLLLFADGRPNLSTADELHTSFRLSAPNGLVALSRPQLGTTAVVDYLEYEALGADQSLGRDPRDFPWSTRRFLVPTPWAPNVSPAPILSASVRPDGSFQLQWASQPGTVYRVEARDTWDAPWKVLKQFTATGATSTVTELIAGHEERFYRVVAP